MENLKDIKNKLVVLNESMNFIVINNVKNFKTDVDIDINSIKNSNIKRFIWITRKNGTNLLIEDYIKVINSEENIIFHTRMAERGITGIYRLTISHKENDNIYGYLEVLNKRNYLKEVINAQKYFNTIEVEVVKNDGTKIVKQSEFTEGYIGRMLRKLKLQYADIKKINILGYKKLNINV